jgi:hypothetical protein
LPAIAGTTPIDAGSRMGRVVFEESRGAGNRELNLPRGWAKRCGHPAIDVAGSRVRREEELGPARIAPGPRTPQRGLAGLHSREAMTRRLELIGRCGTGAEVLELLAQARAPRPATRCVASRVRPRRADGLEPGSPEARPRPAGPRMSVFVRAIHAMVRLDHDSLSIP